MKIQDMILLVLFTALAIAAVGCASGGEKKSEDAAKPPGFISCSTFDGDPKPNDLVRGWAKAAGSVEGVRNLKYAVYTPPNPKPGILYVIHGLCNSGNLEASRWDQQELKQILNGMSMPVVAITYGDSWYLTPHETSAHDETISKFIHAMHVIEARHELSGPRVAIGHSMGGANIASLITLMPDLWSKAVMTNPMIFDCDPADGLLGCRAGLVVNAKAIGGTYSFTIKQWEQENPHALLNRATKPLPPTLVVACPDDDYDLFPGTKIWIGITKKRKDPVTFKPLKSGCDHNTQPDPQVVLSFMRAP